MKNTIERRINDKKFVPDTGFARRVKTPNVSRPVSKKKREAREKLKKGGR